MSDDREPTYLNRTTPLLEAGWFTTCSTCGSVVVDTDVHTEWHRRSQ